MDHESLYVLPRVAFHPLPPSDAGRQQKKKNILENLSSSVLSQFKKYHPSVNLKLIIQTFSKA